MYARVATFQGDPANVDDAIKMVRAEVESGKTPPGLRGSTCSAQPRERPSVAWARSPTTASARLRSRPPRLDQTRRMDAVLERVRVARLRSDERFRMTTLIHADRIGNSAASDKA